MGIAATVVTIVALAALLVAEWRGAQALRWLFKPLASSGFVAVALAGDATRSTYGRAVLAALVLGWIGDLALVSGAPRVFLAGLAVFLAGHLAYVAAFAARGLALEWGAGAAFALAPLTIAVTLRLLPHVPRSLRAPVVAYVVVVSAMVACAIATAARAWSPAIVVGAAAFYLSDLAVALERFVKPGFTHRAWGLPLYYAAQLALAWTVV